MIESPLELLGMQAEPRPGRSGDGPHGMSPQDELKPSDSSECGSHVDESECVGPDTWYAHDALEWLGRPPWESAFPRIMQRAL